MKKRDTQENIKTTFTKWESVYVISYLNILQSSRQILYVHHPNAVHIGKLHITHLQILCGCT